MIDDVHSGHSVKIHDRLDPLAHVRLSEGQGEPAPEGETDKGNPLGVNPRLLDGIIQCVIERLKVGLGVERGLTYIALENVAGKKDEVAMGGQFLGKVTKLRVEP